MRRGGRAVAAVARYSVHRNTVERVDPAARILKYGQGEELEEWQPLGPPWKQGKA